LLSVDFVPSLDFESAFAVDLDSVVESAFDEAFDSPDEAVDPLLSVELLDFAPLASDEDFFG
jgi:hypothetical protein